MSQTAPNRTKQFQTLTRGPGSSARHERDITGLASRVIAALAEKILDRERIYEAALEAERHRLMHTHGAGLVKKSFAAGRAAATILITGIGSLMPKLCGQGIARCWLSGAGGDQPPLPGKRRIQQSQENMIGHHYGCP